MAPRALDFTWLGEAIYQTLHSALVTQLRSIAGPGNGRRKDWVGSQVVRVHDNGPSGQFPRCRYRKRAGARVLHSSHKRGARVLIRSHKYGKSRKAAGNQGGKCAEKKKPGRAGLQDHLNFHHSGSEQLGENLLTTIWSDSAGISSVIPTNKCRLFQNCDSGRCTTRPSRAGVTES